MMIACSILFKGGSNGGSKIRVTHPSVCDVLKISFFTAMIISESYYILLDELN